jgi:hypothetical protein
MKGILEEFERQELREEIASFTKGNPARLEGKISDFHIARISTDSLPLKFAYNVVRYCEMYAWIETPSLLISILRIRCDRPIFANAIARIQMEQPPQFHVGRRPWDTIMLAVDLPFLDRKITREAIECFSYPLIKEYQPAAGIRVLVVNGPPKSGKSYTFDYIRYINVSLGNLIFNIVYIDIEKQFTSKFGPLEFTKALLDQISPEWRSYQLELPGLDNQQPARWSQQLCSVIAEQAAYSNTIQIIVIEGLGEKLDPITGKSAPVSREIIEMVMILGAIATGSQLAQLSQDNLRLVLLGFNHPLPNYMNRLRIDQIQPLSMSDVRQYFENFAAIREKNLSSAALQYMLDDVFKDDVPLDDINRTEKLSIRALNRAKEILGN